MDETRCTLPYGTDTDIYNITHSSTKSNPRSIWRGNRIRLAFHLVVRYNNAIKYPLTVSTVISSRVSKRLKADLPLGAFLYMGLRATRRGGRGASLFSFLERGVNDLETEPNAVKGKKQSDKTIFVVVEDGRVQEVYACASLAGVEVEILDKDDAKVSEDAAWRSTLQRIAEVAEQYTQIY